MDPERDYAWLARYFAGETTEAEQAEMLAWAAADPSHQAQLDAMRRVWEATTEPGRLWGTDAAWSRMQEHLSAGTEPRPLSPAPSPWWKVGRRKGLLTATSAAAVWGIAATLAGFVLVGLLGRNDSPVSSPALDRLGNQEVVTEKGERARIRLLDGTEVTLAPASRLVIPARFGDSDRAVRLSGEAYFDVAADTGRPFLVYAAGSLTRVLGTEFNLRAYEDDAGVQIVVAEGRVEFRPAEAEVAGAVLQPGELGELHLAGSDVVTRRVDLDQHLGWRDGYLSFDNAPLSEVAREIERWYGVPVRVDGSAPASRRVTASFRDQPIQEVVEVIAASLGIECARVGQIYVFRPKPSRLARGSP